MSEIASLTTSVSKLETAITSLVNTQKRSMLSQAKISAESQRQAKAIETQRKAAEKLAKFEESQAKKRLALYNLDKTSLEKISKQTQVMNAAKIKLAETEEFYAKAAEESLRLEKESLETSKTRSQVASQLTKRLEEQGREFNILSLNIAQSIENLQEFAEISAAGKLVVGMEYLDLLLTGTSQKIKIFGIEATTARRVMYGFLPPGMFRLVNKFSTGLRFTSGALRAMSGQGEEANNVFTALGKVWKKTLGLPVKELFPKKKKKEEESDDSVFGNLFNNDALELSKKAIKKNSKIVRKANKKQAKLDLNNANFRLKKQSIARRKAEIEFNKFRGSIGEEYDRIHGEFGAVGDTRTFREYKQGKESFTDDKMQEYADNPNRFGGKELNRLIANIEKQSGMEKGLKKKQKQAAKAMEEIKKASPFRKRLNKLSKGAGNLMKGLGKFIGAALKFFFVSMFYIMGIIALIAILGPSILKGLEAAWKAIQPTLTFIYEMFGIVWDGIMDLWDALFKGGGLDKAFTGIIKIIGGMLGVVGGILYAVGQFAVVFIKEFLTHLWGQFTKWLVTFYSTGNKVAKTILLIAVIAGGIIAAILGAGPLVIVGVMALIYGFGKWLLKKMKFFADGGVSAGGMAVVGEKGPELVNLPAGSRVHSNKDSKKMVSAKGDNITNNFHITINARDTSDKELKRITDKIGKEIANKLNRRLGSPGFI